MTPMRELLIWALFLVAMLPVAALCLALIYAWILSIRDFGRRKSCERQESRGQRERVALGTGSSGRYARTTGDRNEMTRRIHHKGTLAAEAGTLFWAGALGLSGLRGEGYAISLDWIAGGLALGTLLIVWGAIWEMRADLTPVSEQALATLRWLASHCPHAAALLQRKAHPTWADAFRVEDLCKRINRD